MWLKWVLNSGVLDRLPPRTGAEDGLGPPRDPREIAHALLADLNARERPFDQVADDVRRFRSWVEARQRRSRRIILAGSGPSWGTADPAARTSTPDRTVKAPPPDGCGPELNPMWDPWLDGDGRAG